MYVQTKENACKFHQIKGGNYQSDLIIRVAFVARRSTPSLGPYAKQCINPQHGDYQGAIVRSHKNYCSKTGTNYTAQRAELSEIT
jgi:hypothetical protein